MNTFRSSKDNFSLQREEGAVVQAPELKQRRLLACRRSKYE